MGQIFCLDQVESAETVKLVMRTKGPPGHKSLCSFTGSAKERTQNGVVDIPVTQVEIPGIGALGADGLAYGMLPDGEDAIEVTPNAPGGYVYFDVAGTQHRLHIKANGQDCQPLLSLLAPWCIVGQKVTFSPEWDQTPPKIQQSTYKWTLDGTYVNESSQPYTNGSVNWRENASLLTNAQPFGYWISGDREFPGALYDVGLENSLTFSNGQSAKIIEQGNFRMFRPLPGFSFEVRDQVRVDLDNYYKGANLQAGYNLHFGINTPDSHNSDVGIAFVYTDAPVNYNTNTYGDYFITQALESWQQQYNVYSGTNCTGFSTNGGGGLDKDSPYGPIKNTPNGEWTDSPGGPLSIAHWLKEEDSFSTYLMFQPSSVSEGIAVPMYKGTWGWFGSAVNTPPWSKASGSPNVSQPIVTEQFPIWTNIIAYINTLNAPTNNCFPEN
jgi:hypothetical protein